MKNILVISVIVAVVAGALGFFGGMIYSQKRNSPISGQQGGETADFNKDVPVLQDPELSAARYFPRMIQVSQLNSVTDRVKSYLFQKQQQLPKPEKGQKQISYKGNR